MNYIYIYIHPACLSKGNSPFRHFTRMVANSVQVSHKHEMAQKYSFVYSDLYCSSSLRFSRTASSVPISMRISRSYHTSPLSGFCRHTVV